MQKLFKIAIILVITFSLVNIFSYNSYTVNADDTIYKDDPLDDLKGDLNHYGTYRTENQTTVNTAFNITSKILGIITVIGIILAVIIIAMIGFNYVIGSAEEKAFSQKQLLTFLIGAVILASTTSIVNLIFSAVIK